MEADLAGKCIGRYQILEKPGEGGVAIAFYETLDTQLKCEVVLKPIQTDNFLPSLMNQRLKCLEHRAILCYVCLVAVTSLQ